MVYFNARQDFVCVESFCEHSICVSSLSVWYFNFYHLKQIVNYVITEFVQGHICCWSVGWSFIDMYLPDVSCLNRPVGYN